MLSCLLAGEFSQSGLRVEAGNDLFVGILIFQFLQRERAAVGDLLSMGDSIGITAEQPRHFRGLFQEPVGGPLALMAQSIDGLAQADAGEHVLQDAAFGLVKQHIVGGDGGHFQPTGKMGETFQA